MKSHGSEKMNPASKPATKSLISAGIKRAGNPAYADHKPSNKLHEQSAGSKRAGSNVYPDYPDASVSNGFESTSKTGAGSRKGSR